MLQQLRHIVKGHHPGFLGSFQERADVFHGPAPVHGLEPLGQNFLPITRIDIGAGPPSLPQGVVEEWDIGRRPGTIRKIPEDVIEVPAFGAGAREQRVQLSAEKRRLVIMEKIQHEDAADECPLRTRRPSPVCFPAPLTSRRICPPIFPAALRTVFRQHDCRMSKPRKVQPSYCSTAFFTIACSAKNTALSTACFKPG